jgi:hypothetical protein
MTGMTTAAEAEAAISQVADLVEKLRSVIERKPPWCMPAKCAKRARSPRKKAN